VVPYAGGRYGEVFFVFSASASVRRLVSAAGAHVGAHAHPRTHAPAHPPTIQLTPAALVLTLCSLALACDARRSRLLGY